MRLYKVNDRMCTYNNAVMDQAFLYNVHLLQTNSGTIYANPSAGYEGDIVTLSTKPYDKHYTFNGYNITGANLTGDQFKFGTNDVTAAANWNYDSMESVKIGNQIWSMDISATPPYNNTLPDYYYNNITNPLMVDRMASAYPGWHIPTMNEWQTLFTYCGGSAYAGTKLKSSSGWNGTDVYGFDVIPRGYRVHEPNHSEHVDNSGRLIRYWCQDKLHSYTAKYVQFNQESNISTGTFRNESLPLYQFCFRLIKD